MARARDAPRAVPALGAGRPGGDGARRRGPLPVPRPPRVRALGRGCRRPRKLDGMREKVALREIAAKVLPGRDRGARQAAVSRSRGRSLLRPRARRRGWRRRCRPPALAESGDLGRAARRRPSPPLPRGPRDRDARVDGARRDSLHPALASRVRRAGGRGYPPESREPRVRIDRTGEPSSRGGGMTEVARDVRSEMRHVHRGELPLPAPRDRAEGRRPVSRRSASSTRSASSSSSRRSSRATESRSRTSRSPRRTSARSTPSRRTSSGSEARLERPHARRGPARGRRPRPGAAGDRRPGSGR